MASFLYNIKNDYLVHLFSGVDLYIKGPQMRCPRIWRGIFDVVADQWWNHPAQSER